MIVRCIGSMNWIFIENSFKTIKRILCLFLQIIRWKSEMERLKLFIVNLGLPLARLKRMENILLRDIGTIRVAFISICGTKSFMILGMKKCIIEDLLKTTLKNIPIFM